MVCLALVGCGQASATATAPAHVPSQIVSIHIVRIDSDRSQHLPPIDTVIRNPDTAQRLYDATFALKPFPNGVIDCPDDFFVRYMIDFTREDGRVVHVTADPTGCRDVSIDGAPLRQANEEYWSLLAQTLQISRANIYPVPIPCPSREHHPLYSRHASHPRSVASAGQHVGWSNAPTPADTPGRSASAYHRPLASPPPRRERCRARSGRGYSLRRRRGES